MKLWTEKYMPETPDGMAGQRDAVDAARKYLQSWRPGTGLILYGPPGTGKTLLAGLLARERGDFLVSMDASDSRNARDIGGLSEATKQKTLFHSGKIILMDEADSMSGRSDRGGAASIAKIIEHSKFPVIITVNDIDDPKLRPIKKVCKKVRMGKVERTEIAAFLRKIASEEGINAGDDVINGLARWSDGDVRSAVLDFQMLSLGNSDVGEDGFMSIGFRERRKGLEDVLVGIMRTQSITANRKSIRDADADPDDIFLWLESNIMKTSSDPGFIAAAYDTLSRADIYRGHVQKQQNWRFKAYMVDLMSGIACLRKGDFIRPDRIRYPDRIMLLARSRFRRLVMDSVSGKIARHAHCSKHTASLEYLPFLMLMAKKGTGMPEDLELTPDEVDTLRKYGR
ncbi:MAG: replication factor C large subunit [Candidatus Aenigmarchaeota archaeon]|nr:replication factor C large subunit [Candidatus Aenigmarchaeota archaeon]